MSTATFLITYAAFTDKHEIIIGFTGEVVLNASFFFLVKIFTRQDKSNINKLIHSCWHVHK